MAILITAFFLYRYFSKMRFKKHQLETELDNSLKLIHINEQELKTYIIDLSKKTILLAIYRKIL